MKYELQIIRSKNRTRTSTISVPSAGTVVVKVPSRMSERDIQKLLDEKQQWIEDALSTQAQQPRKVAKKYVTGELFPYLGEMFPLEVKVMSRKLAYVMKKEDRFVILEPKDLSVRARNQAIRKVLEKWYRENGRLHITNRVDYWCNVMNLSYNQLRIKEASTRWGSCSSQKNLNFNWKLILSPPEILDYVVIHEVCHLVHQHHRQSFWDMVRKYDPDYIKHRSWLRKNGWKLDI